MEQPSGQLVSHEAIHTALYALPRGELQHELLSYLHQAKPMPGRKQKGSKRRRKLVGVTNIKERPEEVEGRLVQGHWQGDLILGAGEGSAVGTLVERNTCLVAVVHMTTRKADVAASALAGALKAIPAPLRKTLTYHQGNEMAGYAGLAAQTAHSHFLRRPTLTLAARLQREHQRPAAPVPAQGHPLAGLDQDALDLVAVGLNDWRSRTFDSATPNESVNSPLAKLANGSETQTTDGVRYQMLNPPRISQRPERNRPW
jgi:IS30 family transposase